MDGSVHLNEFMCKSHFRPEILVIVINNEWGWSVLRGSVLPFIPGSPSLPGIPDCPGCPGKPYKQVKKKTKLPIRTLVLFDHPVFLPF